METSQSPPPQALHLLPGDPIPPTHLPPSHGKKPLKLGPGLRHLPPTTLLATTAGTLTSDPKKNALWLEAPASSRGRYVPSVGDLVIGTIERSGGEYYSVSLSAYAPNAALPWLAFENATRKTRPLLHAGDVVYARVLAANKQSEVEIQCFNANTGKSEGMGPLKGGMVFDVGCGFARRLMMGGKRGGVVVLEAMSEKVGFEVAVGRNGRVWVSAENVRVVVAVGRALVMADEEGLDEEGQRGLVKKLLKGL